jgi:hypothetical protein
MTYEKGCGKPKCVDHDKDGCWTHSSEVVIMPEKKPDLLAAAQEMVDSEPSVYVPKLAEWKAMIAAEKEYREAVDSCVKLLERTERMALDSPLGVGANPEVQEVCKALARLKEVQP